MPGLVPGIHVLTVYSKKDVDGRDKPGHDGEYVSATLLRYFAPSFAAGAASGFFF
jgi:hypothetical protein